VNAMAENSSLTNLQKKDILKSLAMQINKHYVMPKKAAVYVEVLNELMLEVQDSSIDDIVSFINKVNRRLQDRVVDKHLRLLTPEKYTEMMELFYPNQKIKNKNIITNTKTSVAHNQVKVHEGRHSTNHSNKSEADGWKRIGISNVSEISRDGLNQTGYLAFKRFDASQISLAFLEQVFSSFTESDNIIIDLRECGGGDAKAVEALSNYFFNSPIHLTSTSMSHNKDGLQTVSERWVSPNQLSPYFANKPLTILTSKKTFSAAESFAFAMKISGRADIIGEKTGGGGYMNDFFALPNGLGVSISVGRTFDPKTGLDWHTKGVQPDIQVTPNHALYTALSRYTKQSGKLLQLKPEERQIYDVMQNYTNSWYGANWQAMAEVIDKEFTSIELSHNNNNPIQYNYQDMIENTKNAKGVGKNKIYYNRIIQDIDIKDNLSSVTLILRETRHKMNLVKIGETWKIYKDIVTKKVRS
jgi:C-terminal processing protease CtpA/Prc